MGNRIDGRVLRIVNKDRRGSIASGTDDLTLTTGTLTAADVGRTIVVRGAGAAGADLETTIIAFVDATHVTLGANAGTTVAAAIVTLVMVDLNTDDGFSHQNPSWGEAPLRTVEWFASSVNGSTRGAVSYGNPVARIPLLLPEQSTWDDVQELHDALSDELVRETNMFEWRPHEDGDLVEIDTLQASPPPLYRGQARGPDCSLMDIAPMVIFFERALQGRRVSDGALVWL